MNVSFVQIKNADPGKNQFLNELHIVNESPTLQEVQALKKEILASMQYALPGIVRSLLYC